jgi:hypothetical protein
MEKKEFTPLKKAILKDDKLQALNNLGTSYQKPEKAEPLCVEYVEKRKSMIGDEHPDTLTSMNNLTALYQNQGNDEKAEPLYVEKRKSATIGDSATVQENLPTISLQEQWADSTPSNVKQVIYELQNQASCTENNAQHIFRRALDASFFMRWPLCQEAMQEAGRAERAWQQVAKKCKFYHDQVSDNLQMDGNEEGRRRKETLLE